MNRSDIHSSASAANGSASIDKRVGLTPVPLNLRGVLSAEQRSALKHMSAFGWCLAFVRRAAGRSPDVVVTRGTSGSYALLLNDGTIDVDAAISIRAN